MTRIIQGDCREVMRGMAAESVQMCVTSPPYWGLRDYKLPPVVWGGDAGCEHEWDVQVRPGMSGGPSAKQQSNAGNWHEPHEHAFCRLCGAWRGCLGLEPTPELFVEHIVTVFREVKRILRPDGVCFINLGDSYANAQPRGHYGDQGDTSTGAHGELQAARDWSCWKLKPKDLCGMPWRVAFALQADGWWLRSATVWAKGVSFCPTYSGSVMPESCRDRPTSAYEMVFLMSKASSYYYDNEAVREVAIYAGDNRGERADRRRDVPLANSVSGSTGPGRNLRNVWCINPEPFSGEHFATFPTKLVEPCIKAGSSHKACGVCGAPWERVVSEASGGTTGEAWLDHQYDAERGAAKPTGEAMYKTYRRGDTTGWRPTCEHGEDAGSGKCVVLDPFAGGSGRVGLVCKRLGRDFIGIELSEVYAAMSRKLIEQPVEQELFA